MGKLSELNAKKQAAISSSFWKSIKIPEIEKNIEIKSLRTNQIKAISEALAESKNTNDLTSYLSQLTKVAADDSNLELSDVLNLSISQFIFLVLQIRALSKGNLVKYKIKCPKCEKHYEVILDIEHLKYELSKNSINIITTKEDCGPNEEIHYMLKDFNVAFLLENVEVVKDLHNPSKFDNCIASFIQGINFVTDNEVDKQEFDSNAELIKHVGLFSPDLLEKFSEYISNFSYVFFEKKDKCSNCGFEHTVKVKDMLDFLY